MSGTVPIDIENSLRRELCLGPNTVICWRLCNRPELIYNVEPPVKGNDHLDKQVLEIIGKHNLRPTERGLIFVTTVEDGIQLASFLKYDFYWSMKTKASGADGTDTGAK